MANEQRAKNLEAAWQKEQRIRALEARWQETNAPEPEVPILEQAETAGRSFLEGMTLGVSEPVASGVNAGIDVATDYIMGSGNPEKDKSLVDELKAAYDRDVGRRKELKEKLPYLSVGSEMAGAILPAFATGGTSAPASVAKVGTKVLTKAGKVGAGLAEAIPFMKAALKSEGVVGSGARLVRAGAEGAASAAAAKLISDAALKPTGFKEGRVGEGLLEDAAFGAKFGAGVQAIPEAARVGKKVGKSLLTTLGGVSGKNIDAYLANPEAIRNAKTMTEIKDEIDAAVGKIRDDVEAGKISLDEANEAVKAAKADLRDKMGEAKQLIQTQKWDIAQAKREAESAFNIAKDELLAPFKNVRPPTRMADDVLDAVSELKGKVSEGSSEAYEILGKAKGTADISGLDKEAKAIQDGLSIGGKEAVSDTARKSFQVIQSLRERLQALPKEISLQDAKKLIQQLDSDIRYVRNAGEFSDDASRAMLAIRQAIDARLKDVPGYAEKMKEVAENTRLLSDSSRLFGRREGAVSKLANIDNPSNMSSREVLERLGEKTGRGFGSTLKEYVETKMIGRDPEALADMAAGLPEAQGLRAAEIDLAQSRRPDFGREQLAKVENASSEALSLRAAQGDRDAAQTMLRARREALEPFKRITPETSQNVIRSVMNEKSVEFKRTLEKLSKVSEVDFIKMITQLEVAQSFNKEFRQGSRNVNLWALLGLGATTLATTGDPISGLAVMGGAAGFGGLVDKFGPAMTKRILDGVVKIQGMPTLNKIDAAFQNVPPQVRDEIKADLLRALQVYRQGGPVYVPESQRTQTRNDVINSDLSNTKKAHVLSQLNKSGKIEEDDMIQIAGGTPLQESQASEILQKAGQWTLTY